MHKRTRFTVIVTALVAGLVLTACAHKKGGPVVLVPNCPAVGIVKYTSTLTRFARPEKTNQDVIFDAYITDLKPACSETGTITTDLSFSIRAKKGLAFEGATHTINYFVVVIRDNYLVVSKKRYSTQIRFTPGQDTAGVRETIRQTFDSYENPRRYDYEVLVGLELSPEELEFNVMR